MAKKKYKQIVEGIFRNSVKLTKKYYILKLQVNMLAHTKTLCDYLVFTQKNNFAVECKQITLIDENRNYSFERLSQKEALINWQQFSPRNKSFVFLGFVRKKKKESIFFLIPLDIYLEFEGDIYDRKVSLSDCEIFLNKCRVYYIGGDTVEIGQALEYYDI